MPGYGQIESDRKALSNTDLASHPERLLLPDDEYRHCLSETFPAPNQPEEFL